MSNSTTTLSPLPSRWRQHLSLDLPKVAPSDCIWVHACSMGEVASIRPMIEQLLIQGHAIHLTVVTRTGMAHSHRLFGAVDGLRSVGEGRISISYMPWDLPIVIHRFMSRIKPVLFLLTETEFWPGILGYCKKKAIPVIGINTRISDRSFPRYYATRRLWKRWLTPIKLFLAQSEVDATRLHQIGIESERITTCGNLKYAIEAPQVESASLRLQVDATAARPILLIASTHDDEESQLLNMWPVWRNICPDLLCLIVPRHPERFDDVARIIKTQGIAYTRWSDLADSDSPSPQTDMILVDCMGILTQLYTIADIAFIGGSLVTTGGHNPLEAAICGRGVITGPHVQNFREIMLAMQQQQAAIISNNADELEQAIGRLLTHPDELRQLHANAALFMQDKAQVVERVMQAIQPYLPKIDNH